MIRGLRTRIENVHLRDSGEDMRIRSRSWEDDSWSWQHCWQLQRSLAISTNTPDGGNPEDAI